MDEEKKHRKRKSSPHRRSSGASKGKTRTRESENGKWGLGKPIAHRLTKADDRQTRTADSASERDAGKLTGGKTAQTSDVLGRHTKVAHCWRRFGFETIHPPVRAITTRTQSAVPSPCPPVALLCLLAHSFPLASVNCLVDRRPGLHPTMSEA